MYDKDFFAIKLTKAEIERLSLLAEECAEVIQVVNKALIHGFDSYSPSDPNKTSNRTLLEKELADIGNAMFLCINNKDINMTSIEDYAEEKVDKLNKYLHYNELKVD